MATITCYNGRILTGPTKEEGRRNHPRRPSSSSFHRPPPPFQRRRRMRRKSHRCSPMRDDDDHHHHDDAYRRWVAEACLLVLVCIWYWLIFCPYLFGVLINVTRMMMGNGARCLAGSVVLQMATTTTTTTCVSACCLLSFCCWFNLYRCDFFWKRTDVTDATLLSLSTSLYLSLLYLTNCFRG